MADSTKNIIKLQETQNSNSNLRGSPTGRKDGLQL